MPRAAIGWLPLNAAKLCRCKCIQNSAYFKLQTDQYRVLDPRRTGTCGRSKNNFSTLFARIATSLASYSMLIFSCTSFKNCPDDFFQVWHVRQFIFFAKLPSPKAENKIKFYLHWRKNVPMEFWIMTILIGQEQCLDPNDGVCVCVCHNKPLHADSCQTFQRGQTMDPL